MNTRSFVSLLITILLLVATRGVPQKARVLSPTGSHVADGSQCTPWTPDSCPKPTKPRVADGGQCTPWTPDSCPKPQTGG